MHSFNPSRRSLLKSGAAGIAAAGMLPVSAFAAETTVGIIYVGPRDDFGWNQSHAVAAKALKGLADIKVVEEENVPETIAVQKSMASMIELDGASLILATSFGYFDPHMIEMAKKYPKVQFRHATTLWNKDKHPGNAGGYYCYLDQGHYINGIAAGLSTTSNKLGFIAAKPIPIVLRNINSFLLGARKVNPKATVQLIITGDWSLPVREAEATNALVDAGCDVIACHVDSPKIVVETAEKRGAKSCGHNANQSALAPKGFITGAELKWSTAYTAFAASLAKGAPIPNILEGGFDTDFVQNTAFGPGASEAARKACAEATADLKAGKAYYVGPLKDNTGKVVVEKTIENYDGSYWGTNFLLEGIVGSIT